MLEALEKAGDDARFHPHPFTKEALDEIARREGKDYYCVLVDDDQVRGYGMLRGWDEGYEVPSLGIAVHPALQGKGLGKAIMQHLHDEARRRGSAKIRLRVRQGNDRAIGLYRELGYAFQPNKDDYLEGFLEL